MNPNPQDIRKQLADYEKAGDFCSTFHVAPWKLNELKNLLFKKPDTRALFGPIFQQSSQSEEQDEK